MHMSDRRRWQESGSAVSRRLTYLFGYTVVANATAHSGPGTALAEGSASAPRACQSAHRSVRPIGGTISRRFEIFICSCAATLLFATRATTADRRRPTLGRCALRRAFLPMHLASSSATGWSTGPCTSGCRRRPCSTCLTCFRLLWSIRFHFTVTEHFTLRIFSANVRPLTFSSSRATCNVDTFF